jgi:cytosine/creatinine deaminase
MRAEWAGRIDLQGHRLWGVDRVELTGNYARTADIVADHGGVLGWSPIPSPTCATVCAISSNSPWIAG